MSNRFEPDDDRLATLDKADIAQMEAAQRRYQHIATSIDDAVTNLQKIVDTGSDGLRGQWVEPLKDDAKSIKDSLGKAAVRYHDAATEIKKYQPDLQHAIDEVAAARSDGSDAAASAGKADAMPDPHKDEDGEISADEKQKGTDKQHAQEAAAASLAAATNRITNALNALDVAGKRFGDAVNQKRYDDGLTDTMSWHIKNIFDKISDIFGVIALILTALALVIPGVNAIAIAGAVAGAVLLIADSVLLAGGEGSVLSVVLDAVGLGFAGLGAAWGQISKTAGGLAQSMKNGLPFKIKMGVNTEGVWIPMLDFGKPAAITAGSAPAGFFADIGNLAKGWAGSAMSEFLGLQTFRDLSFLGHLGIPGANGLKLLSVGWGSLNQLFNVGAGLVIGGMQVAKTWPEDV